MGGVRGKCNPRTLSSLGAKCRHPSVLALVDNRVIELPLPAELCPGNVTYNCQVTHCTSGLHDFACRGHPCLPCVLVSLCCGDTKVARSDMAVNLLRKCAPDNGCGEGCTSRTVVRVANDHRTIREVDYVTHHLASRQSVSPDNASVGNAVQW